MSKQLTVDYQRRESNQIDQYRWATVESGMHITYTLDDDVDAVAKSEDIHGALEQIVDRRIARKVQELRGE